LRHDLGHAATRREADGPKDRWSQGSVEDQLLDPGLPKVHTPLRGLIDLCHSVDQALQALPELAALSELIEALGAVRLWWYPVAPSIPQVIQELARLSGGHEFTEAEIQAALAQEGTTQLVYLERLAGRWLGEYSVRVEAAMLLNQL